MRKKQLITLLIVVLAAAFGCTNNGTTNKETVTSSTNEALVNNEQVETEKKNLATALKFVNEGLNKGSMTAFDECVDTSVIVHTGLKPTGPINGLDEYKSIFSTFLKAWPQVDFTVHESFAAGDKVVIRFNSVNHFTGEYYGMKPTNQIASLKEAIS